MAKLPYTWTICPDEPAPKQFTALTPRLLHAMRSGGMDFTIDHRVLAWPASKAGKTIVNNHLKKKHE
jgi:hypothetical protein